MGIGYGSGYGSGDGYGYDYDYGDGSGSGYGDGYGSGSGYGCGYGYGYGYGYGDGDGDGSGYGDGDGSGYGCGSRYGYGYGYGSGDGSGSGGALVQAWLEAFVGSRAEALKAAGVTLAYWWSDKKGKPSNGGSGGARHAGLIEEIEGPLALCGSGALHGTLDPSRWKGERLWVVALYPPVVQDDDKVGSLKREIICEVGGLREEEGE